MRWRTIAVSLAIFAVALAIGILARLDYGFRCFYERSPYGSACDDGQAMMVFVGNTFWTAVALYTYWGFVHLIIRWRRKGSE